MWTNIVSESVSRERLRREKKRGAVAMPPENRARNTEMEQSNREHGSPSPGVGPHALQGGSRHNFEQHLSSV